MGQTKLKPEQNRMDVLDKIATIVPIAHLDSIKSHYRFMALSHLMSDETYASFYKERIAEGKWVTLDNSAVELGHPEDNTTYLEKALELGASEIMLPDYFQDNEKTLSEAQRLIDRAIAASYMGRVMGIPQGKNVVEWTYSVARFVHLGVHTIGISYRYLSMFGGSRLFPCYIVENICEKEGAETNIHLLGAALPINEDATPCLGLSYVRGVDSSIAAKFTKVGKLVPYGYQNLPGPVDLQNDKLNAELLYKNVTRWRGIVAAQVNPALEI